MISCGESVGGVLNKWAGKSHVDTKRRAVAPQLSEALWHSFVSSHRGVLGLNLTYPARRSPALHRAAQKKARGKITQMHSCLQHILNSVRVTAEGFVTCTPPLHCCHFIDNFSLQSQHFLLMFCATFSGVMSLQLNHLRVIPLFS